MQHATFVRGGETGADAAGEFERFVGREASDAAEQRREVFTIHVFHGQEVLTFNHADVVHAAHVGVRHLPRDADFVAEARERGLISARVPGR